MFGRVVVLLTTLLLLNAITATACETGTAQQVADALNNAPGLESGLKSCSRFRRDLCWNWVARLRAT